MEDALFAQLSEDVALKIFTEFEYSSREGLNVEKPFLGCLGRMVNLFDLSPGIAGNRKLMDRPHQDGSSLARSQSDVFRTSSPFGDKIEDKLIVSKLRRIASSNIKSNGTPMKMPLDQEMSKEIDSRNDLPNVVAKLMGLEELPRLQPHSLQRSHTNGYSRSELSRPSTPLGSWQQEFDAHTERPNEYKDVYVVWQKYLYTDKIKTKLNFSIHDDLNLNIRADFKI